MQYCELLARNLHVEQQTECICLTVTIVQLPEHFFEQFGAVCEVRPLLPELFPDSCVAPPAAVAVPCTRIIVHDLLPNYTTVFLRCTKGKFLHTEKLPRKLVLSKNAYLM